MFRTKNIEVAESLASEHLLGFGLSAIDGWYYVGYLDELDSAGVPESDIDLTYAV
jgi:hypothetical protein